MIEIIDVLKVIVWPLTCIVGLLIFRYPINSFLEKTHKLKIGELTVSASEIAKEVTDQVTKNVTGIIRELQYGEYLSRTQAFDKANILVEEYLNNRPGNEIYLDIKITAVGMHYSWPAFVSNVSVWLQEHSSCKINLAILLVDPTYLNKLPFSKSPIDWADESERRIRDVKEMVNDLSTSQKERLSLAIKVYEGLPQYHGILINDDELFLGRTDWEFRAGKQPQLTVGQNRYRYFDRATTQGEDRGSERVNLFLHWHKFHYYYNSKAIIEYINGIEQTNDIQREFCNKLVLP
jgi:hypothetical protein